MHIMADLLKHKYKIGNVTRDKKLFCTSSSNISLLAA